MGFGDASDATPLSFINRAPDQTAYVVPDIEVAMQRFATVMGITDWVGWDYTAEYLPTRTYDGAPATYRSIAAVPSFGPKLEVIQPIQGPSVFTTFLETHGPGLHHLGYFVPSQAEVREWFAQRGIKEIMSGGGHGVLGDGEFTYFDTWDLLGSYLEFIEVPQERHPPHFTWTFTP